MRTVRRSTIVALFVVVVVATGCSSSHTKAGPSTTTVPVLRTYCAREKLAAAQANAKSALGFAATAKLLENAQRVAPPQVAAPGATILQWVENVGSAPDPDEFQRRVTTAGPEVGQAYADVATFVRLHCTGPATTTTAPHATTAAPPVTTAHR